MIIKRLIPFINKKARKVFEKYQSWFQNGNVRKTNEDQMSVKNK